MPLDSCIVGHRASKSSRDQKVVDYSPRKRPEMPKITSFDDAARVMYGGHRASKSSRDPKVVDYSLRKRPEMSEIMSFDDALACTVTGHRNPPGTQKPWTIAHENGQKCPKSRVLMTPLESCTGGHRASKSNRDPKTVDYSPRKRPEMPEIKSFDDALESCTGGHGASKSSRDPKTVDYSPRKGQ